MGKRRRDQKLDAELDALYAEMPEIKCKGLCAESCGPIHMSRREHQRIRERGVTIMNQAEALNQYLTTGEYECAALKDERCTVYEVRPLICRMWGLVDIDSMRCPWGCVPEYWLTTEEGRRMIGESLRIGGGDGQVF